METLKHSKAWKSLENRTRFIWTNWTETPRETLETSGRKERDQERWESL